MNNGKLIPDSSSSQQYGKDTPLPLINIIPSRELRLTDSPIKDKDEDNENQVGEAEEGEEDEDEEASEDEQDIGNDDVIKKSKRVLKENKTSKNEGKNSKRDDQSDSNNNFDYKQKESEYIAQIEQLENELQIEVQITNTIQADPVLEKEILKLKKEVEEKTIKVSQLQKTNIKQQKALDTLTKELDSQIGKSGFINQYPLTECNQPTKKHTFKDNPIDILLKVKEKELNNTLALIEILSKDNTQMKKVIDSSKDYHSKLELIDNAKLKEDQISKLNKEIQLLNKQLEEHKTCILIKKDYTVNHQILKDELKQAKEEHTQLKEKLNEIEAKYKQATFAAFPSSEKNMLISIKKNRKMDMSSNNSNSSNILPSTKHYDIANNHKRNKVIKSVIGNTLQLTIFTPEERKQLEKKFLNPDDYEEFIKKINRIESFRTTLEPKHKNEIKQFVSKIDELDQEISNSNTKCKEHESQNRIYCFQINELKNTQKSLQKKYAELQAQMDAMQNATKEKDQEIKLLTHQVSTLKKVVKHGSVDPIDCEISKYIEKIKKKESATQYNEVDNNNKADIDDLDANYNKSNLK